MSLSLSLLICLIAADPLPSPYAGNVDQAIVELGHKEPWVRWHAAYALGQAGPKADRAVEPLTKVLQNKGEDEYVRGTAAWALARIAPQADPKLLALLAELLSSKHISVRRNAATALGQMGPRGKEAVEKLEALRDDADPIVRVAAAEALWKIDPRPERLAPLLKHLEEAGPGAFCAATALGDSAAADEKIDRALVAAFSHADDDVRRAASDAVVRRGEAHPPSAELIALLATSTEDQDPRVRRTSLLVLGRLGGKVKAAAPAVVKAANDPDPAVRQTAAWAMGKVE